MPQITSAVLAIFCLGTMAHGMDLLNTSYAFDGTESHQLGRISRDSVPAQWSAAKSFPGTLNTTTSYGVKIFTITPGAAQYVQISLDDPKALLFAAAFLDSYNPATGPAGNPYLGDAGGSGDLGPNPNYFQIFVPFGHSLSVVLNEVTPGAALGRAVGLQVEGFGDTQFSPPFALGPDLTVSVTHPLPFYFGGTSDYVMVVTNAGTAPSAGTITLTDALPAAMTAEALAGAGWNCVLTTLTCTSGVSISPGASASPVRLTALAPIVSFGAELVNMSTVAGGGDQVPTNNASGDVTTVIQGRVIRPHGPILRH